MGWEGERGWLRGIKEKLEGKGEGWEGKGETEGKGKGRS
jgi:hypothetical protein